MRRFTTRLTLSVAVLGAVLSLNIGAAYAGEGIAARPSQLSEQARASLRKEIEAYRSSHPEAFEALRNVKGHRPEFYKHFRNPIPIVGRELRRLGPAALLPMLEALVFEAPSRGNLTDQEWSALAVGMLEAVGVIRDLRGAPVLRAIFQDGTKSAPVLKAAGEALGRLCGDAELALLIKRSAAGDALRLPAIHGLGHCRRTESAAHLAGLLAASPDDASAEPIAAALGVVASSWAWRAMGPAAEAAAASVRELAAKALVAGFVRHGGEARVQMRKALLMAEHRGTADLLAKVRPSADAAVKVELDSLIAEVNRQSGRR